MKKEKPCGIGRWKNEKAGLVVLGEWEKGKLHGNTLQQFEDGHEIYCEMHEGKYNGIYLCFYSNGAKVQGRFTLGKKNGEWREYDSNGVLFSKTNYTDDKRL